MELAPDTVFCAMGKHCTHSFKFHYSLEMMDNSYHILSKLICHLFKIKWTVNHTAEHGRSLWVETSKKCHDSGHTTIEWCHSRCFPSPVEDKPPAVTSLERVFGQDRDMFESFSPHRESSSSFHRSLALTGANCNTRARRGSNGRTRGQVSGGAGTMAGLSQC